MIETDKAMSPGELTNVGTDPVQNDFVSLTQIALPGELHSGQGVLGSFLFYRCKRFSPIFIFSETLLLFFELSDILSIESSAVRGVSDVKLGA